MKRNWPYYIVALCLALLCVLLFRYPGRVFPSGDFSEVYRHYCDREDLRVEFFKDFRIDDSTTVDVTTLTARDSASWEALLREMNVNELFIELDRESAKKGNSVITFYICKKNHPEKHSEIDDPNIDMVLYTYKEKTLYVFNIESKRQKYIIQTHKVKETFSN